MKSKPQCKICQKTQDLIKHHITKPLIRYKLSEQNNEEYITLCRNCHVLLHTIFWDKNNFQKIKGLPIEIPKINKPYIDHGFLKMLTSQGYNANINLSELAYYWALWYYTWIEANIPSGRTLRLLKHNKIKRKQETKRKMKTKPKCYGDSQNFDGDKFRNSKSP